MPRTATKLITALAAFCLASLGTPAWSASLAADLQKSWEQQKGMIMMTAGAMPEESFDSRPTPEQRTFGEQLLHIAGANSFLMSFTGTDVELTKVDLSSLSTFGLQASTKQEILAELGKSFENGSAALNGFSDDEMLEEVQGPPWVGNVTRAGMVTFILGHTMDIYGQLAVYLRLEGVVPPLSRR